MAARKRDPYDDGRVIARMDFDEPREPVSRREMRWAMAGALRAALLVAAVISAGMILFIGVLWFAWR